MNRVDLALKQIQFARDYSLGLLRTIPEERWYEFPPSCPSHIGWQAGHLAMAEYRLSLSRIRGERESDVEFFPTEFLTFFGKGSVPERDRPEYPRPERILQVMERVHQRVLSEVCETKDEDLDLPPFVEHPRAKTRLACLLWCAEHEMLHAGQIGLIRRMQGFEPLW